MRGALPRRAALALSTWWMLVLIGCNLMLPVGELPPPTLPQVLIATLAPSPTPDPLDGLEDARAVMAGVCFEAAYQRRDRLFVLRSDAELVRLYNEIDESQHCRRPIQRGAFDFSGGRALVGLWSYGVGCTASHTLTQQRDEAARTLTLQVALTIDGDCNYELIRPLWVAVVVDAGWQLKVE